MENKQHIKQLFKKYLDDKYSKEDLEELLEYFDLEDHIFDLKELIEGELESESDISAYTDSIQEVDSWLRDSLFKKTTPVKKMSIPYLKVAIAVAASLLLVFGIRHYKSDFPQDGNIIGQVADDIHPGTNKAVLQLDNGEAIVLREDMNGILMDDDQIIYNDGSKLTSSSAVHYATLRVPRAGQYQATLPDGTKVWLNAETVLKYPTRFNGSQREVELEGEAYFEVTHNANQPFIVRSQQQSVQVLGTSFNINTVMSRTVTTLIEGSVQLLDNKKSATRLSPGQQAIGTPEGFIVKNVDVENYIAWKEGVIVLNKQNIHDIINQLERWYDVEFVNTSTINSKIELSGDIPRDINLSGILQALEEQLKIKFKIEGRRIIINQ